MTPLRIGTRGSALALAQARLVADRLAAGGRDAELVSVPTAGDQARGDPSIFLTRGVFVTAIEEALLAGRVDLAVHSAKDLPSDDRGGTTLVFPARGEPRDALVGGTLASLPSGARVGTESPRRKAFLLHRRPDLAVVPVRGNVDSRLGKLERGEVDALVLAACGLERLGLAERIGELLPLDVMVPAVGQGALAVQARAEDRGAAWLAALDDERVRREVTAERRFLAAMGGGCRAPFAAHARHEGGELTMEGAALSPDGRASVTDRVSGDPAGAEALGRELASRLLARGAARLAQGSAA